MGELLRVDGIIERVRKQMNLLNSMLHLKSSTPIDRFHKLILALSHAEDFCLSTSLTCTSDTLSADCVYF